MLKIWILFLVLSTVSIAADLSDACRLALGKIPVRFTTEAPKRQEVAIETPTRLTDLVQKAVATVKSRGINDPAAFREAVQKEVARERAIQRAKESVAADNIPEDRREREIVRRAFDELKSAQRETVLFVDTPVVGADGKSLNETVPLVIDHHGAYAPKNPLDNSGAQVLLKLKAAAESSPNSREALKKFQAEVFGSEPGKLTLSADNLADAAEVMAVLRNPNLQKRILENPELQDMLIESGRFTDFFVFGGDGYEKNNTSERSKKAIALSKAIMQSHSDLLKEFGVGFGDRVVGIKEQENQKELLQRATSSAEALLLAATSGDYTKVNELAGRFDKARNETSLENAKKMHETFKQDLSKDLPNSPELVDAINSLTFGHKPVSTGNQFADWGASPMANAQSETPRPIKFELAGADPGDVGKPVILAKSGGKPVDLRPLAEALNRRAVEKSGAPQFVARGTDLVFSFGGHSLTRLEIVQIVGEVLKEKGNSIVRN